MTSRTKLWALSAGALALSLALAGCGGGGSGGGPSTANNPPSDTSPSPSATPTQVSLASVTMDGGNVGYMAPMATGDDPIEIDAGMSADSGSVTFTCAAGGDDCTVMVAADGSVTSTGGTVTAANSMTYQTALDNEAKRVTALAKETALREKVAALQPIAGADDAAGSALMMAAKYADLIGTEKSDGDSLVAKNNAQAVLDARKALEDAIAAAKTAKTEAMTAKDALDPGQTDLIGTLTAVITSADTAITAAENILNGDALASSVEMVTGADEDNLKTAADTGMAVAEAVAMALGPTVPEGGTSTADGAGLRVSHSNTAAPTDATAGVAMILTVGTATPTVREAGNPVAMANKYEAISHDPESMTWEMIVGEDNVMMRPLGTIDSTGATFTAGNGELPVASLAGMDASDVDKTATRVLTDGSRHAHGDGPALGVASATGTPGIEYMGIPGRVVCLGGADGCSVSSEGELSAGWYFSPVNPKAYWMKAAGATAYSEDVNFATYGHWLVVDDSPAADAGEVYVATYAYGPATATTGGWAEAAPGTPGSEQAVYTGMAAGRSVHKVSNEDVSIIETHSGRFTATVSLTAKFGSGTAGTDTAPMLGGTVSGFQSDNPDAVDSDWTVTLVETEVAAGAVASGVTTATGQDGTWSATSYGGADAVAGTSPVVRPAGIFGGFNAHFTDGHVAGAYAVRND